jgi:hypothetical protein
VEDDARSALHDMLAAAAGDLDLDGTPDGTPVDAEILARLAPALVDLLGLEIRLAAQARSGTGPSLAGMEEALQAQCQKILRLLATGGDRPGRP